jgi:hypothetical protein
VVWDLVFGMCKNYHFKIVMGSPRQLTTHSSSICIYICMELSTPTNPRLCVCERERESFKEILLLINDISSQN